MSTKMIQIDRRWPTAVDLFSGCGGTTQGLRDARFRVVGGVEIDPLAVSTYKANHPCVKIWMSDVRDVDPIDILNAAGLRSGELDVLSGCPPCQSFSELRRLNGGRRVRDKRNKDLVFEMVRFAEAMRPRVIMMENVPRLSRDHRISIMRRELRGLGYQGSTIIVDAADYGVPQRRRRMLFVASRIGQFTFPKKNEHNPRRCVMDAIGDLKRAGSSGDPLHDFPEVRSPRVSRLIALIPKNGGSRSDIGEEHQLDCHRRCKGFRDVYGRMAWNDVAPTITGGCVNPSKGRFLHPEEDRTITLREAALLQSFPAKYQFSLDEGKFKTAQLIGNAFPPILVAAHASAIRLHLKNGQLIT